MSIVEKFMTMEYGPAPEDPREALAWLDRHSRRFGHFITALGKRPRQERISTRQILPRVKNSQRSHKDRQRM